MIQKNLCAALAAIALVLGGATAIGAAPAYAATTFKDVPASHPFYSDIIWLADRGITTGYTDGTFHPSESVSRAAYAAFLYRMSGKPNYTPPKTSPFRDVPANHQFYKEISWLASVKVTTGWDMGGGVKEFRPEQKIARDAMAAFMYRYACSPTYTPPKTSPFRDVPIGYQFYKEIAWMKTAELSTGWEDGTYRPLENTERAAIAAFLHRYSNKNFTSVPLCTASPKPTVSPKPSASPTPTVKPTAKATPTAVTFADGNGVEADTFTVPSTKGVTYKVGGKIVKAGTYKVKDHASYGSAHKATLTVVAEPATGYQLTGTTQWSNTFDGFETAAAAQPTFNERSGGADKDTIVIPNSPSATYTINGKTAAAGTHKASEFVSYKDGSTTSVRFEVKAVAKDGYRLTGTTSWSKNFDGRTIIAAAVPTFDDPNGSANDAFIVPKLTGVQYVANGKSVVAGTHKVTEVATYSDYRATVKIEAQVAAGYKLDSNSNMWTHVFDGNTNVTPAAPTFTDKNGMASDTVTIPDTAGVTYSLNGKDLKAGTHKISDVAPFTKYSSAVAVEAKAKVGHRIKGTSSWNKTYSGITTTTATAVTFTDENGKANDTFTVPARTGVTYYAGSKALGKGTYKVADYFSYGTTHSAAATVTAKANAGYQLSGTTEWAQVISGITTVTPDAVTFTDKNGAANDTFTVPNVAGVQYVAGGKNVAGGKTYKVQDYFTYTGDNYRAAAKVTAKAKDGYALSGTTEWSKAISGIMTVTPAAVTFTDENGMASDTIVIPNSEGVDYYAGNKLLAPGTHKVSSAFSYGTAYSVNAVVTAKPKATYALTGTTEWKQTISGITTTSAKAVTFSDVNGPNNDTFTVPNVAGVQYVANGKNVEGGKTYKVKDYFDYGTAYSVTAKVTAKAKAGYKLEGTAAWSKKMDGITTVATQAVTFSDVNGPNNDTFTVPNVAGVQYVANGKNVEGGKTYKVKDYFDYGTAYSVTAKVTATAKAGYKLSGDTAWSQTMDGITTVTPAAVTYSEDANGMANDTFTVPNTTGVQYVANGKNVGAGTYKVGDYFDYGTKYSVAAKVTAKAKAGYKLSGTTSWSKTFSGITTVATKAVTFTDKNGSANDTFTVPNVEGVQYVVNGKNVESGKTYKVKDYFDYGTAYSVTAEVTATAKAGYKLSGDTNWSQKMDGITTVATKDVTFNDVTEGFENDTFTVPNVTGVQYVANGKNVGAGTYKVSDYFDYGTAYSAAAKVTAKAKAGYKLSGTTSWSATFDGWKHATTKAPTFGEDQDGQANDTFTIPNVAGVQYKVNGTNIAAGTYKVGDKVSYGSAYEAVVKITAVAKQGYKITGDTSWQKRYDGYLHVPATAPTFTDAEGSANDILVIPSATGVTYRLNDTDIAAGTYKVTDKLTYLNGQAKATVTAVGKAGYAIYDDKNWEYTYTEVIKVDPKAPTVTDADGKNNDTITIPSQTGVQYRINGTNVAAGTYKVSSYATYNEGRAQAIITAVAASSQYAIQGTGKWTRNFTAVAVQQNPTFNEAEDKVTIPNTEGVFYTIDGMRVNAGTYPISGFQNNQQRIVVHAYLADTSYENGITKAIWNYTYSDGSVLGPMTRDSHKTNDYGSMSASEAQGVLSAYANELYNSLLSSNTYSDYTTIGQVLGLDNKSVYQGTEALNSWNNARREIAWRYAARYQQRLDEIRAQVGLNPVKMMRLTDDQEQQLITHVSNVYNQGLTANPGGEATAQHLLSVTMNSGSGYGWDGADIGQIPTATSSGYQGANGYAFSRTPEALADAAIVDILGEVGNLTSNSGSSKARLTYLLSDRVIAHYPSVYFHSVVQGSDSVANSTLKMYMVDDYSYKNR